MPPTREQLIRMLPQQGPQLGPQKPMMSMPGAGQSTGAGFPAMMGYSVGMPSNMGSSFSEPANDYAQRMFDEARMRQIEQRDPPIESVVSPVDVMQGMSPIARQMASKMMSTQARDLGSMALRAPPNVRPQPGLMEMRPGMPGGPGGSYMPPPRSTMTPSIPSQPRAMSELGPLEMRPGLPGGPGTLPAKPLYSYPTNGPFRDPRNWINEAVYPGAGPSSSVGTVPMRRSQ